jgi:hypothetical protein
MAKVNILTKATESFRRHRFNLDPIFDIVGLDNINFEEVNSDGNNILIEYVINFNDWFEHKFGKKLDNRYNRDEICDYDNDNENDHVDRFLNGVKIICRCVDINHSNHEMMTALDYATKSYLRSIYHDLLSVNDNINPECIRKYINHPDFGDDTKTYLIKHNFEIYDEPISNTGRRCVFVRNTSEDGIKDDINTLKQTCGNLKEVNDKLYSNYESLRLMCLDLKEENTKLKNAINGVIRYVKSNSTSTPKPTLDSFTDLCDAFVKNRR